MLDRPFSKLAAGVFASLAVGALAGACTATLDFTECREDSDCSAFFVDDKPMRCDDFQCVARTKCDNNSQCAGLGEGFVCTVVGTCVQAASDQCAAPIYPEGEVSDDVVLIGSLVAKSGPEAALGAAVEKAIAQAVADFNAGTKLQNGKGVALVACDTQGTEAGAEAAAEHLGEALAVPAILGPTADREFAKVTRDVTQKNGVRAFVHSPTAAAELNFDDADLAWQTAVGVRYQGRAIAEHLAAETARMTFGAADQPPVTRMLFNQADGFGYPMYYAIATEETEGTINRIPEAGAQKITSYKAAADGMEKIVSYVDGTTQALIVVGGPEVAELLAHFATTGNPWPKRVYISSRSAAAVAALGDAALGESLRVIGPDLGGEAALAIQSRVGDTTPEVALAYDATMATLLAMSGIASGTAVTGPSIVKNMARLNKDGGTAISFADDPKVFVKAAAGALVGDGTLQISGGSGSLDYDAEGTICNDLAAFTFNGEGFTLAERFVTDCPNVSGSWSGG